MLHARGTGSSIARAHIEARAGVRVCVCGSDVRCVGACGGVVSGTGGKVLFSKQINHS
jgi:hypothetical protein